MRDNDEEQDQLKKKVGQLQLHVHQYVPVKGDEIDIALAHELNEIDNPDKFNVAFIRLKPGVYTFGTRKVSIKLINGKVNIRVGGGYLKVDEFLDKYSQIEKEKSLVKGIDPTGGESSPIRKPSQ